MQHAAAMRRLHACSWTLRVSPVCAEDVPARGRSNALDTVQSSSRGGMKADARTSSVNVRNVSINNASKSTKTSRKEIEEDDWTVQSDAVRKLHVELRRLRKAYETLSRQVAACPLPNYLQPPHAVF